jgi:hypothetical protein
MPNTANTTTQAKAVATTHATAARTIVGLIGAALLAGCASNLVAQRAGSDSVAMLEANQVTQCQNKGSINVSVISEVGLFTRSADAVEGNLLQLARNGAVDAGADTVVKGNSMAYGKRAYDLYKCR